VPEVPGQLHRLEARVEPVLLEHEREAVVAAAVVDEHDLRVAVELREERRQPGEELREDILLVEDGDDDRVLGRVGHGSDVRLKGSRPHAKPRCGMHRIGGRAATYRAAALRVGSGSSARRG